MPENELPSNVGGILGALAFVLSLFNSFRKATRPDEERVQQLAERVGVIESKLVSTKEALDKIQDILDDLRGFFRRTEPKRRGDTPPRIDR